MGHEARKKLLSAIAELEKATTSAKLLFALAESGTPDEREAAWRDAYRHLEASQELMQRV